MKVLKLLCKLLWLPVVVGAFVIAGVFALTMIGEAGASLVFGASMLAWCGYAIADNEGWFG